MFIDPDAPPVRVAVVIKPVILNNPGVLPAGCNGIAYCCPFSNGDMAEAQPLGRDSRTGQSRHAHPRDLKPTARRSPAVIILLFALVAALLGGNIVGEARFNYRVKGKPAPDFKLADLNGTEVSLSGLRGNPVLLAFWAYG